MSAIKLMFNKIFNSLSSGLSAKKLSHFQILGTESQHITVREHITVSFIKQKYAHVSNIAILLNKASVTVAQSPPLQFYITLKLNFNLFS